MRAGRLGSFPFRVPNRYDLTCSGTHCAPPSFRLPRAPFLHAPYVLAFCPSPYPFPHYKTLPVNESAIRSDTSFTNTNFRRKLLTKLQLVYHNRMNCIFKCSISLVYIRVAYYLWIPSCAAERAHSIMDILLRKTQNTLFAETFLRNLELLQGGRINLQFNLYNIGNSYQSFVKRTKQRQLL
jgi:hypothetical protein